jgi:hypothetical protein
MFPLNTIIAWSINIIMNKKYDNNNIITVSRAYLLQEIATMRMDRAKGGARHKCDNDDKGEKGT